MSTNHQTQVLANLKNGKTLSQAEDILILHGGSLKQLIDAFIGEVQA